MGEDNYVGEKEELLERLRVDNEVAQEEVELEQRRALIKQIRREYGRDWKKMLGLSGKVSLQDLRVFLRGCKQGLQSEYASARYSNRGSRLDPAPPPPPTRRIRRVY